MIEHTGRGLGFWLTGLGLLALAAAGGLLLDMSGVTSRAILAGYLAVVIAVFGIWAARRRR